MKNFLKNTLAVVTAVVIPAVYSPEYAKSVSAVTEEENTGIAFSVPEFHHTANNNGDIIPAAKGIQYHGSRFNSRTASAMPSKYDMREYSNISSVKNQDKYGTCWTHSSATCAETSVINADPAIDLAEMHTAYYTYYGDDQIISGFDELEDILDNGGDTSIVINLWSQWIGPVYESRMPYGDLSFFDSAERVADMQYQSDYHLENAYTFEFDNDRSNESEINSLVKTFIYGGFPVDVSFYYGYEESYNPETNCSNTKRKARFANHAVTIAGWDDSYPAENFLVPPEHDGAWLVKNSWGYDACDEGYMWISYEDKSLCNFAVYELADKDDYKYNFHHDTFVPTQMICAVDDGIQGECSYMANIFTAENDTQIDAIGTYFQNAGTDYEITIYSGLSDETDPSSGTPSGVTAGQSYITGYSTVSLDSSVNVKAGDKFGVVVKLRCEENPYIIPVESSLYAVDKTTEDITDLIKYSSNEQIVTFTGQNESFYSIDGETWYDLCGEVQMYDNEEKAMFLEAIKYELYDGIPEDDTEALEEAEMLCNYYSELIDSSDLYIGVGNISLKAFGNPAGTVSFSHVSGEVPTDEAVALYSENDIFVSVNDSEYVPYTEPIKITEDTKISAYTTDPMVTSVRKYTPAKAGFNALTYMTNSRGHSGKAEKISDDEYAIYCDDVTYAIQLYPETSAEVILNGENIQPYTYSDIIPVPYGESEYKIKLSEKNKLDNEVTLHIVKSPVIFNLEKEFVSFQSNFTVTAKDGKVFTSGDMIGEYAGQELTVKNNKTNTILYVTVPERAVLPEMTYDRYFETLGFIPNETAELLTYSIGDSGFIGAEKRLVDGTWINSGMVMNKAFKVIPGETLTLKISAGNGMLASEPVTIKIPDAPEAPEKMPVFEEKDGRYYLSGYEYEIALLNDNTDISSLHEKWGYSDNESLMSAMQTRYGVENIPLLENILLSEWGTDYALEKGQVIAYRSVSTDDDFASECRFITVGETKGDVNRDGFVDAVDSSAVLWHYAELSTTGTGTIENDMIITADYNDDGMVDAVDATAISVYYAKLSTIQDE